MEAGEEVYDLAIDVELDGFSGPLDLLCHLVENREIEAASISISTLVRVYAAFLKDNHRVPINTLAEFMSLAARLLVGKLKALFPAPEIEITTHETDDFCTDDSDDLMAMLKRYRPYRNAAQKLLRLQEQRNRHFCRPPEEGTDFFDLGDLYSLSYFWWRLTESPRRLPYAKDDGEGWWDDDLAEGVPDSIPEGIQVDRKMEDLREKLSDGLNLSLHDLVGPTGGRPVLIVTLLALLELSRLGEISIRQKEVLGDVRIEIVSCPVQT